MYRLSRRPAAQREGAVQVQTASATFAPRASGSLTRAAQRRGRTQSNGRGRAREGGRGRVGYLGVLKAPAPPLRVCSRRYCSVSFRGARPGLEKGQRNRGHRRTRQWGSRSGVPSESPQTGVASRLQAAGEGAGVRAQGLYVNGDSGWGRGKGLRGRGPARSGPGGQVLALRSRW